MSRKAPAPERQRCHIQRSHRGDGRFPGALHAKPLQARVFVRLQGALDQGRAHALGQVGGGSVDGSGIARHARTCSHRPLVAERVMASRTRWFCTPSSKLGRGGLPSAMARSRSQMVCVNECS